MIKAKFNGKKLLTVMGWVSWMAATFLLTSFIIALILVILQHYDILNVKNLSTLQSFLIDASMYVVMFLIVMVLPLHHWRSVNKSKKEVEHSNLKFLLKTVKLNRLPKLVDLRYFLTDLPIYYVTLLAVSLLATLVIGSGAMNQAQQIGFNSGSSQFSELVVIFLALVVVAPFFEEMMMRGFLFGKLRSLSSFWLAAIITSLLFAVAHGQLNVGLMTFILSMFGCYMTEKTGSIWASLWLHMTVNFVAFSIRFLGLGS